MKTNDTEQTDKNTLKAEGDSVETVVSVQPIFVELEGYRIETWTEENKEENAKAQLEGWRRLGSPKCNSIKPI